MEYPSTSFSFFPHLILSSESSVSVLFKPWDAALQASQDFIWLQGWKGRGPALSKGYFEDLLARSPLVRWCNFCQVVWPHLQQWESIRWCHTYSLPELKPGHPPSQPFAWSFGSDWEGLREWKEPSLLNALILFPLERQGEWAVLLLVLPHSHLLTIKSHSVQWGLLPGKGV